MKEKNIIKKTGKTITDGADQIFEQFKNGVSRIGDLGTNTKNKFIDYVKDVFNVLPLLEKAGFRTNRLIVGVSIPPSVEIHFSRFKEVDKEEIDLLYEEYKDKKMFKMILKALLMSNEFQSKLSSESLVFAETCIEISIPPKVSIKYLNKEVANIHKIEADFD
ncbi:hypothetical protein BW723_05195 [Polaribacter reichenbachii]|uniref:Uncharacterized protein n=1 Tax=Polaribacter reichenbachii TaxID=996801 RepID=A0A1B8TUV1_9FLAO|nr:hypothetical protein [Polaribacter reichenbachii]APZ45730.1 hypothetical protein BW723_05195 [Polaribacter reichenbachii]AUC19591.1 hypothetical protein BTO17_13205 [Polaribacter reichenbachii]OBY63255.1 hypothetical protein LPB301_10515 [Polaribacter reichenbachii]